MIEHKKKGIPGSKGEEIFKQNVFTQLLNCASKNNIVLICFEKKHQKIISFMLRFSLQSHYVHKFQSSEI